MITIYSDKHQLHQPDFELSGGKLVEPYECAQRIENVLKEIKRTGLGEIRSPDSFDEANITAIHDENYIAFLQSAWNEWNHAGNDGPLIPLAWPARRHNQLPPKNIVGRAGYYAHSVDTAIVEGSWQAAQAGAMSALTGAKLIANGEQAAFSLSRPPGHHAARDLYGGYSFLNNAAIAAQYLLDHGAKRVAILDIDFHHGNGTQDIFYDRADVLFVSIHGDPALAYPYFLGHQDERGSGDGKGYNVNLPLPPGTEANHWRQALLTGIERIQAFDPAAIVVSLGVDAFESDPISFFRLSTADFYETGRSIRGLNLPTLFVMEGGYAIEEIGSNVVGVLQGFDAGTN